MIFTHKIRYYFNLFVVMTFLCMQATAAVIKSTGAVIKVVQSPPAIAPGVWTEIPNSKIRSVLPNPIPKGNPGSITVTWNGGAVDTKRNRLIVMGGGHSDYWGNEIYAFDANTQKIMRLTNPSSYSIDPVASQFDNSHSCPGAYPDGQPVSRHTYGNLVYHEAADKLLLFGGAKAPCGDAGGDAWSFDFNTNKWTLLHSSLPFGSGALAISYEPASKLVFIQATHGFFSYNYEQAKFTKMNDQVITGYHLTSTIDTKRRKFIVGGYDSSPTKLAIVDLVTGARQEFANTGGEPMVSASSPGLSYDISLDRVVAWSGGSTIYQLNLDNGVWTKLNPPNGPQFPAIGWGTFGRFGYIPALKIHVLIDVIDYNVFVYKP